MADMVVDGLDLDTSDLTRIFAGTLPVSYTHLRAHET